MNVQARKITGFISILLLVLLGFGVYGHAQFFDEGAGGAEPDIETEIKYDEGLILFKFSLDEKYHFTDLKNGFFKVEVAPNDYIQFARVHFPKTVPYHDEQVFKGDFDVKVLVKQLKPITEAVTLKFTVSYQICQEEPQEVCFPPDSEDMNLKLEKSFTESPDAAEGTAQEEGQGEVEDESFASRVEHLIKRELEKKSILLFLLVFVGGFLTSLTPCVYPVIPIVMSYIGSRSEGKKMKGLYLSLFFVLGLSVVYSTLGVVAAATGSMMGSAFQNPIVVVVIAAVFILMGLSMAGFFEIPVPSSIASKAQSGHKNEILGAMLVGGVSGIIAAPCVGPVLIGLLSWISQTGDLLLGFLVTFVFTLGMSVIFVVVGTTAAAIPRGGKWMSYVKYFFAVLLLGAGVYFITSIAADWLDSVLWGMLLIATSVFMGLFKPMEEDAEAKDKLFKFILVLILLIGAFMFFEGLGRKYSPQRAAVAAVAEKAHLPWILDLEEGKKLAAAENKIMMMDSYADWCVACIELEEYTFTDKEVAEKLNELVLVKMDFTKKDEANDKMRKSLGVIGMPTVIFFNPDGSEIDRFSGFRKKDKFLKFLAGVKSKATLAPAGG